MILKTVGCGKQKYPLCVNYHKRIAFRKHGILQRG